MTTKTIPFATGLYIEQFSGASITESSSTLHNMIIDKYGLGGEERLYITQRPGIDVTLDISEQTGSIPAQGRGLYYWTAAGDRYFVADDNLYKGTSAIETNLSGTDLTRPVYFVEGLDGAGNEILVLMDHEGNDGYWIETDDTVNVITDAEFPCNNGLSLAQGVASLDGYTFVLTTNGQIWNSALDDIQSWSGLDFIEAEREPDSGMWIGKHHDHVVAIGGRTIEFFYNAGNPSGSPLNRRSDLAYNVGCAGGDSVWQDGDIIYFLGVDSRGTVALWSLNNFQIAKLSDSTMDSFLTHTKVRDGLSTIANGFSAHGHSFYVLTIHSYDSLTKVIVPHITLVYDSFTKKWSTWDTDLPELSDQPGFPLVQWSMRTGTAPRFGEGILSNGDIVSINDALHPYDTLGSHIYIDNETPGSLYVEADYYTDTAGDGTDIAFSAKMSHFDAGSTNVKLIGQTTIICDPTSTSQELTVEWSDDGHSTFSSSRTLDLSKSPRLTRCGSSRRRTIQLSGAMDEQVRIEGVELEYDVTSH